MTTNIVILSFCETKILHFGNLCHYTGCIVRYVSWHVVLIWCLRYDGWGMNAMMNSESENVATTISDWVLRWSGAGEQEH